MSWITLNVWTSPDKEILTEFVLSADKKIYQQKVFINTQFLKIIKWTNKKQYSCRFQYTMYFWFMDRTSVLFLFFTYFYFYFKVFIWRILHEESICIFHSYQCCTDACLIWFNFKYLWYSEWDQILNFLWYTKTVWLHQIVQKWQGISVCWRSALIIRFLPFNSQEG